MLVARTRYRVAALLVSILFIARLPMLGSKIVGGGIDRIFRLTLEGSYVAVLLFLVAFLPLLVQSRDAVDAATTAAPG
jgi:hypothetical protein